MSGGTVTDGLDDQVQRGFFRLTEADMLHLMKRIHRPAPLVLLSGILLLIIAEVAVFACGQLDALKQFPTITNGTVFMIVFGIGNACYLALLIHALLPPGRVWKASNGNHTIIKRETEHQLIITEDWFSIATKQEGTRFQWADIDWWAPAKDILILATGSNYHAIPTSISAQGIDLDGFTSHFMKAERAADMVHRRRWQKSPREPVPREPTVPSDNEVGKPSLERCATYNLSAAHITSLAAALHRPIRSGHVLCIGILFVNLIAAISFVSGANLWREWVAFGAIMFHVVLISEMLSMLNKILFQPRKMAKQRVARWKGTTPEFKVEMTADALNIGHDGWWVRLHWDHVRFWRSTSRAVFMTTRLSTKVYFIPASIAESGFDIQALIERLKLSSAASSSG